MTDRQVPEVDARGVELYYLFSHKSAAHIQFYNAWVEAARANGVPMVLLGVLPDTFRSAGRARILQYAELSHVKILRSSRFIGQRLRILLFLLGRLARGRRVIVQVHKVSPDPLDWLKRFVGRRLQYAITLEGDPVSEAEYLREHPFRPGFYEGEIANAPALAAKLRLRLQRADRVLLVTQALGTVLDRRYPELRLLSKSTVVPTGFDQRERYFSERIRNDTRRSLGVQDRVVLAYIGNIYYTWQNFARTVEIFQLLRRETTPPPYFLLLIRQADHDLAREFLNRAGIPEGDYRLEHVGSAELTRYLNAADLGVVLRHDHPVNRVAGLPGKLGDYAGCGLPVLTNRSVVGSGDIARIDGGAVLDDMDDDDEVLARVRPLLQYDPERRRRVEAWAHGEHSAAAHMGAYGDALRDMIRRTSGG